MMKSFSIEGCYDGSVPVGSVPELLKQVARNSHDGFVGRFRWISPFSSIHFVSGEVYLLRVRELSAAIDNAVEVSKVDLKDHRKLTALYLFNDWDDFLQRWSFEGGEFV